MEGKWKRIIVATIIVVALGVGLEIWFLVSPTRKATRECEEFVREQLKAPATATFSNEETSRYPGSDLILVTGDVDAQNSYGALLRNDYNCLVDGEGALIGKLTLTPKYTRRCHPLAPSAKRAYDGVFRSYREAPGSRRGFLLLENDCSGKVGSDNMSVSVPVLTRCMRGCCYFVDGLAVDQEQYDKTRDEEVARTGAGDLTGRQAPVIETLVACRQQAA